MKRFMLVFAMVFGLIGCSASPIERTPSDNPDIKVDLLFTKDGCTVYRFHDNGYARYFANCSPGVFGDHHTRSGKTQIRIDDTIPTGITYEK